MINSPRQQGEKMEIKKKRPSNKNVRTYYLGEDTIKLVKDLSERYESTLSEIIRVAVAEFAKNHPE